MRILIHEGEPRVEVEGDQMEAQLTQASNEARAKRMLNLVLLEAASGNELAVVLGGEESVLVFTYVHRHPPCYASHGHQDAADPVLTAYLGLQHHTEFARRHVISRDLAMRAVREFGVSGELPKAITWEEI